MKPLTIFGVLALAGLFLIPTSAHAQVSVGIGVGPVVVGPAPVCAYGYYPYYPYACAPYGYYGPQWFVGGVFIGAGPWYHGYWGHPVYGGHPGYWGHPGYGPRPVPYHGPARGYSGSGGFHSFSGSAGFHGAGTFHGGGRR